MPRWRSNCRRWRRASASCEQAPVLRALPLVLTARPARITRPCATGFHPVGAEAPKRGAGAAPRDGEGSKPGALVLPVHEKGSPVRTPQTDFGVADGLWRENSANMKHRGASEHLTRTDAQKNARRCLGL